MASTLKKENDTQRSREYVMAVFEIELHFRPSCNVQCTLYSGQRASYSVHRAMCSVQRAMCSVFGAVFNVQCALYFVQCVGFLV